MSDSFDAIVVGSGAGGGIVACLLAEAGQRVLLLERGKVKTFENDLPRDHLRNHRLSQYGHNTGPDLAGHPRVFVDGNGHEHVINAIQGGYHNNAMSLGGGTTVYGAQAWRYLPDDFRMASKYGVPKGSSLSDWPVSYEEMEPYYERAEWEMGVSGDHEASLKKWPRKKPFPMPKLPDNPNRLIMQKSADKLGWHTCAVPVLINSVDYDGRPACVQCGTCVGFACPSNSKNGSHNTVIPRALKTGNLTLILEAQAERIDTDAQGKVVGVSYVAVVNGSIERKSVRAKKVIVSAGAIESARLLLNSKSQHHPNGLGNETDMVGRNLQGHVYVGSHGLLNERNYDGRGPGVSLASAQWNHNNPGIIGGGMLANEFITNPINFYYWSLPPEIRRWGAGLKKFMRENYTRVLRIYGPIHDIPSPESRVRVAENVRDKFGNPVAKLSGTTHPESMTAAAFMREKAIEWNKASGAVQVWSGSVGGPFLSGGQHQAGTCRMGNDPATSVTDSWGRVHGHDNLYVADGSLHVTNGGFNPVLTIMALAFRVGEGILKSK